MTATDHATVCTLDCPDTCALTVTVENGRIAQVRGREASPSSEGVICNKVARLMPEFVHGPTRIVTPLRRAGPKGSGRFEPVSWDVALDLIHAGVTNAIRRHGPQSVLPLNYAGPHGMIQGDSMSLRFFHKLGASQLFRRSLCGAVRAEAWSGTFGSVPGCPPELVADADLNIVWGNNATVANLHVVRRIRQAMRKGGKLLVIDPLRTKIAEQADLHLAPYPSTDVVLAFAIATELERIGAFAHDFIAANVLGFDEFMARAREFPADVAQTVCGVGAPDIARAARMMADAKRLVIAPGNGWERGRNGGSGVRAAYALPALLGKLGNGSGIAAAGGFSFPKTPNPLTRPDLMPPGTRTINIMDVGRYLADDGIDPPIRAAIIYNHNPIVVHPDQNRMRRGLAREDIFLAGIDISMTESMAYCDVVLPASTHFEYADIYGAYGHHWLQRAEPVIPPQGQSLPNTEIFRRLAARFGFADACFTASDAQLMDDAVDAKDARLGGKRGSTVPLGVPTQMLAPDDKPMVLFDNVRPATPSGKIELKSETLAARWGKDALLPGYRPPETRFPLALISPASDKRISSTFGGLGDAAAPPPLLMHPLDAGPRGLKDGDEVRLWNDLGEVFLPLHITDAVRPGVVSSMKGAWLASSRNGQTISALASADRRADLAEGACFNDTPVDVCAAA
jgi:anaerobic selenocysteine-containing dehydrogenase